MIKYIWAVRRVFHYKPILLTYFVFQNISGIIHPPPPQKKKKYRLLHTHKKDFFLVL